MNQGIFHHQQGFPASEAANTSVRLGELWRRRWRRGIAQGTLWPWGVARNEAVVNFYDRWILPSVLDLVMRQHQLEKYRRQLIPAASGRVLEVGVGSGLNFPQYGKQVEIVFGIDPSPRLLAIARRRAAIAGIRAELVQGSATAIPLADNTIDTVVMTWALCSIPDPLVALREMRRVLTPHGRLLFVEHGLSPEPGVERWQHKLTPLWSRIAGSCHLDRKMDDLIRTAGFDLTDLRTEYAQGPRAMAFMYQGCAQPTASAA